MNKKLQNQHYKSTRNNLSLVHMAALKTKKTTTKKQTAIAIVGNKPTKKIRIGADLQKKDLINKEGCGHLRTWRHCGQQPLFLPQLLLWKTLTIDDFHIQ